MKSFALALLILLTNTLHADEIGIATAHPMATDAGIQTLEKGGNAFDAAITVSAVLAVVEPYSSGIGGGGFWLLHDALHDEEIMLDGRETAPEKATANMYLDKDGNIIPKLSIDGPLAAGIPGAPAALVWLAKNKGDLKLQQSLQPAIDAARKGFPVDQHYRDMLKFRLKAIQQSPEAAKIFLHDNQIPEIGSIIKQPELAKTLERIAEKGNAGFYDGETAKKLVEDVTKAGGIWTLDDLKNYKVKLRTPITVNYKDMRITSAALPSSGGIVMSEIFNILASYPLNDLDQATRTHLIVEAMRRAYRDRAEYMGDEDFVTVPKNLLTSKAYATGLRQSIRRDKATPSESLAPTWHETYKGTDTTHFSILDADGNKVSATLSINYPFGSGFVAKGTGVLLNDEMDDFSSKPGEPNVYGLVGNKANAIEPNKRMLSSMSPTFVETDDRIGIIGTPGGSRIITMVTLGALAFQQGKNAEEIVNLPRFHHQYLPDQIQFETKAFDSKLQEALEKRGHKLEEKTSSWGNMHIVILDKTSGKVSSASDSRGIGKAVTSH